MSAQPYEQQGNPESVTGRHETPAVHLFATILAETDSQPAGTEQEEDVNRLYAESYVEDSVAPTDPVKLYLSQIGRVPLLTAEQEVTLSKRIEAGLYASHLLHLRQEGCYQEQSVSSTERHEPVPGTEYANEASEDDLRLLEIDGEQAKRHMTEANLRLVVSLAKRYQGKGLDLLELIQEGNLGLIHAVEKFDYKKGFKFSTYATWWLRQTMSRAISDQARVIRLPVHMVEVLNKVNRARSTYLSANGHEATPEQLADITGYKVDKVKDVLEVGRDTLSLQAPMGSDADASELQYFIADENGVDAFQIAAAEDLHGQILKVMHDVLPERAVTVLTMRYGLLGGEPMTLDAVGHHIGLTRERVRQIESKSILTLRGSGTVQHLKPFLFD